MTKRTRDLDRLTPPDEHTEFSSESRPVNPDEAVSIVFADQIEERARAASEVGETSEKPEVNMVEKRKFENLAEAKQIIPQRLQEAGSDARVAAQILTKLCNEYDYLIWNNENGSNSMPFHNIVWEAVCENGNYYAIEMLDSHAHNPTIYILTYRARRRPKGRAENYITQKCALPAAEEITEKVHAYYLPIITEVLKKIGFKRMSRWKNQYNTEMKRRKKKPAHVWFEFDSNYVHEMIRLHISVDDDEAFRDEILEALRDAGLNVQRSRLVRGKGSFIIIPDFEAAGIGI
jgi:hypothetical protein